MHVNGGMSRIAGMTMPAKIDVDRLRFEPLTLEQATEVATWRYEPPYDFNNILPGDVESMPFADESGIGYHAVVDNAGPLIGYFCLGPEGWVPGQEHAPAGTLDVGMGLRPDLLGKGLGTSLLPKIMAFAATRCSVSRFRTAVRTFNDRSLRMCWRSGFREVRRFDDGKGHEFAELIADFPPT